MHDQVDFQHFIVNTFILLIVYILWLQLFYKKLLNGNDLSIYKQMYISL